MSKAWFLPSETWWQSTTKESPYTVYNSPVTQSLRKSIQERHLTNWKVNRKQERWMILMFETILDLLFESRNRLANDICIWKSRVFKSGPLEVASGRCRTGDKEADSLYHCKQPLKLIFFSYHLDLIGCNLLKRGRGENSTICFIVLWENTCS